MNDVVYGSAKVRAKLAADSAVADEIGRRLESMRTKGFRGKFTVTLDDGPILRVVMESSVEVRLP